MCCLLEVSVRAICAIGLIISASQLVGVLVFGVIQGFCYSHRDSIKEMNIKIAKSQHFNAQSSFVSF